MKNESKSKNTPRILWQPTEATKQNANLTHYFHWLQQNPKYGFHFDNYDAAWQWSVDNIETFWVSLIEYFDVKTTQKLKLDHTAPMEMVAKSATVASGILGKKPTTLSPFFTSFSFKKCAKEATCWVKVAQLIPLKGCVSD